MQARNLIWLAFCAAMIAGAPARAENWDMYVGNSVATVPTVRNEVQMLQQIDQETNHALQVRLHLGGSLQINVTTIAQAVGDNVVQMADDVFFSGAVPVAGVPRLPMLVRSQEEYAKIAPIIQPYIDAAYEKRGVLVLGTFVYPVQVAFARKKLTSLDDLKGMKMRVTSPEQGELVKRFGGIPITMGTPEVPAALDRGVIDGAFTASAGAGYTWKDLIKYNYRLGVNYVNAFIIVNKASFEKLPPDVQTIVRRVVAGSMDKFTADMLAEEDNLTKKMQQDGMIVTAGNEADANEAVRRMQSMWDEWAKAHGPDCVAAVAAARQALGR